ncbi:MAG TPA: PadR family transcriptional regulator [Candidatus Paceibacterota bacterium]
MIENTLARKRRRVPSYYMLVALGHVMYSRTALHGSKLAHRIGIGSGTLYPLLDTMVADGMLTCRIEAGDPKELKRPLCKFYEATQKGKRYGARYRVHAMAKAPKLVPFADFQ